MARPIPIALVITDLDVGGAERALVALATRLDRAVWNPSIVCLGPEGALAATLRDAGLRVDCLGCDTKRPIRAVVRLAKTLRSIRPALIQSFLFHANFAVKLAAPLAGWPWVLGGIRVAEREKAWHLACDRRTQKLSVGAVCVSEGVRRFSIEVGGLDPDRLTVIPNGVNLEEFNRARPVSRKSIGLEENDRIALFVGRLTLQKGIPQLLDAFNAVALERPDWKLVLVGDGPDREALVRRVADDSRLAGRVVFLGRRDDVPSLMKTADLLVLFSLWEGMPNVVMEAMAAGLPVCVTNVEGVGELVDERTGWVADGFEPSDLKATLLEATSDESERRIRGGAGREKVARKFSHETVVSLYEQLWLNILGQAR